MRLIKTLLLFSLTIFVVACSGKTTYNAAGSAPQERATLLIQTYGNEWSGTAGIQITEVNGKVIEEKLSHGKVEFLPGEYTFRFEGIGKPGMIAAFAVGMTGGTSAIHGLAGSYSGNKQLEEYSVTINMKAGYIYLLGHMRNQDGTYSIVVREI